MKYFLNKRGNIGNSLSSSYNIRIADPFSEKAQVARAKTAEFHRFVVEGADIVLHSHHLRTGFGVDPPQQLQLQVIIRPEIQKQLFLRKVQPVRHPLVRSPQAASLRLPDPAGRHLISKPFQINSLHDIFTLP